MGSDSMSWHRLILKMVSIHAPTWGATYRPFKTQEECWFQSTLPHGERRGTTDTMGRGHQVSIHAPTWGATYCLRYTGLVSSFQSTLPHGERLIIGFVLTRLKKFQSTLPHGERRLFTAATSLGTWFQSTLPHGERLQLLSQYVDSRSFNPRSHMGSDAASLAFV